MYKFQQNESSDNSDNLNVASRSTILKWLENSDLIKTEGSRDIFKAICNESDSSDENNVGINAVDNDFGHKYSKFNSKLQIVQNNLKQLESELLKQTKDRQHEKFYNQKKRLEALVEEEKSDDEDDDDTNNDKNVNFTTKDSSSSNGTSEDVTDQLHYSTLNTNCKESENFLLLTSSITTLREAFNELSDHMTVIKNQKQTSPSQKLMINVETQYQTDSIEEHKSNIEKENGEGHIDEIEEKTSLENDLIYKYQTELEEMQFKLSENENKSLLAMEQIQIESEELKDKINDLTKLTESLRDEKEALEKVITENKLNALRSAVASTANEIERNDLSSSSSSSSSGSGGSSTSSSDDTYQIVKEKIINNENNDSPFITSSLLFEKQMKEELAAINNTAIQREEELILYKERLEFTQNENHQLKNDIADLKLKYDDYHNLILRKLFTYGAVCFAILLYFVMSYF